ncbi:MAG: substrate-binding domain-containing protein [Algisphaera sp.]
MTFLALAGCRPAADSSQTSASQKETLLNTSGSITMLAPVSLQGQAYQAVVPKARFQHVGGESDRGLVDLIAGDADIARVSRPLTAQDYEQARRAGVTLRPYTLGFDAVTVVVHPDRAKDLAYLTPQIARKIFLTGEINTWAQLGVLHDAAPLLQACAGPETSGSTQFFYRSVAQPQDPSLNPRVQRLEKIHHVMLAVANNPWAMGVVPLSLIDLTQNTLHPLPITNAKGRAIQPHPETVRDRTYPWSRPLNAVVCVPVTPPIARFLDFSLSHKGQQAALPAGISSVRSTMPGSHSDKNQSQAPKAPLASGAPL